MYMIMYIHVFQIIKNRETGLYILQVTLIIENIFQVSLKHEIERKRTCFTWRLKWEKFEDVLTEKKVTLLLVNSNMVTPEKCHHLYLVYHFTVPLNKIFHHVCEKKLEDNFKVAKRFKLFS